MGYNQNGDALRRYKTEAVVQLLVEKIDSIPDVYRWVEETGVSRRWLCKAVKEVYGKPSKEMIRKVRYEAIIKLVKKNPEMIGYEIAKEVGLKDGKALYKFLSTHFGSSLNRLRVELYINQQV